MSDAQTVDQPGAAPAVVETGGTETAEAPPLSVKEHATLYSEKKADLPADQKAALEAKAAQSSDQQQRERDGSGKFTAKTRHRAASQQARPEDVPRIRELTARAKTAEDGLAAANAELARLRTVQAPPAQVAAAERKVEQAEARTDVTDASDPEPHEDDPKYQGDYGKFLRDAARWDARQTLRADKAETAKAAERAKVEEAKTATIKTFAGRLDDAKAKYDDFDQTLQWDAPWLQKSGEPYPGLEAIHFFILEDEAGPDVLHYLRTHPEEADAILRVPPLQQVKRLTLLGQRFASPESAAAENTGAAPGPKIVKLPPKPLTPVGTAAQRTVGAPPMDGSLSVMGHAKAFPGRR